MYEYCRKTEYERISWDLHVIYKIRVQGIVSELIIIDPAFWLLV
jgi:hypothetical protein